MNRILTIAAVAAFSAGVVGTTFFVNDALADGHGKILERQQGFKDHVANIKSASAAVKAGNAAGAVAPAKAMAAFAKTIPSLFPEGTGKDSGHKTEAHSTIWSDWAGFEKAAMANAAAAEALAVAAATGDIAKTGAALKAVGGTCGACHDEYRKK